MNERSAVRSTRSHYLAVLLAASLAVTASSQSSACWEAAAQRYGVSSQLLYAIARTESGLDPRAVGRNRNGSRDIGLMQINSGWLPTLARHGIHEADLYEPCTSIQVGAWILAQNIARLGYTWDAVGAYNATRADLRAAYVARVRRHLPAETHYAGPVAAPTHQGLQPLAVSMARQP